MAEDTKPTEVKPGTETKPVTPARAAEVAAAVKTNPAEKLTAQQILDRVKAELKTAEKLVAAENNFGPGKPGKVKFKIPSFPAKWRLPDIKTINANGKIVYKQGATYMLTYDEIQDIVGRWAARVEFEQVARHGGKEIDINMTSGGNGGYLF